MITGLRPAAPAWLLLALLIAALISACGSAVGGQLSLRLGYLPTLTQAPALVGVARGYFARALGPRVGLRAQTFSAGPAAVEALFAGSLDAAFVGPNPAINAFSRSGGEAVRVVAGATSGGAELVLRGDEHISSPAGLRGKRLATPQLGNTQDVALRSWLGAHGLRVGAQGGGDVLVEPTDSALTLQLFGSGQIDGAWVPEPYASRLVVEEGGTILVDERSLWPDGRFPSSLLMVSRTFLRDHPEAVRSLLRGELDTLDLLGADPARARAAANSALAGLTQRALRPAVVESAWSHLSFTPDPLATALQQQARGAEAAGLIHGSDLHGLLDLHELNAALAERGRAAVGDGGLGAR